jgi:DNA-binding XRE family transcriptional regulator
MTDEQQNRLYAEIGDRVRAARDRISMSQGALAAGINLSRVSVVNIEKGRQRPPLHVLIDIGRVLEVDLTKLIPTIDECAMKSRDSRLERTALTTQINLATKNPTSRRQIATVIERLTNEGL